MDGKKLPSTWASSRSAHPYEAVVVFDDDGDIIQLDCRRISPTKGNAQPTDMEPAPDHGSNTLDPLPRQPDFYPGFVNGTPPPEPAPDAEAEEEPAASDEADAAPDAPDGATESADE